MGNRAREIRELSIRNIGVIEEAAIHFGTGFNVITGETGAGKTMVLTGLNLLAGARSDADLVRSGKDRLIASARVSMESAPVGTLGELLATHDPEIEENELILQRSISSDGKGKAILGSDPATVAVIGAFSAEFFAIHGQLSNHKLLNAEYQRAILDRTSGEVSERFTEFELAYQNYRKLEREFSSFRQAMQERDKEIASLQKFLVDVDRVKPLMGEWEEIETTIHRLDSVEDLRASISGALNALDSDEFGVLGQISAALRSLENLTSPDGRHRDIAQRLKSTHVELHEIVRELSGDLSALDVDPGDLDRMRERRSVLKQFLQRNRQHISGSESIAEELDALIEIFPERRKLLNDLQSSDSRSAELERSLEEARLSVLSAAMDLSVARRKAADELATVVNMELAGLGLGRSSFMVSIQRIDGESLRADGIDEIEFLFAAHDSGKPLPLNKGVSGGELSRVMLAIELALAHHRDIGTLVFDEIDAGIGGETGLIIGERLSRLARDFQVIVITHLAQVAVWADRHFKIDKNDDDAFVLSSVIEVDDEARVREIARMLSGQSNLEAAKVHAVELLKHAGKE